MRKLIEDKAPENKDERLIHADSGEGGQLDLSPDKEKIDKEVTKELKDRVKYVQKEINDAETPKPEATTGDGKKKGVEGLTKPIKKLKEKLILEEPSDILSERLTFDEDDMNEAIPKDAINAYKYHYSPNRKGPDALDFQNSNLTEISPEDALEMIKSGNGDNIRMLIGGRLVKLSNYRNYGDANFRNQWVTGDKSYKTRTGKTITDTKDMPARHLLSIADKIYSADEKMKDRKLSKARSENPESPNNHSSIDVHSPFAKNWWSTEIRGSGNYPWRSTYDGSTGGLKYDMYRAKKYGDDRDRAMVKDTGARLRYLDSERDLQKPTKKYQELKSRLKDYKNRVNYTEKEIDQLLGRNR